MAAGNTGSTLLLGLMLLGFVTAAVSIGVALFFYQRYSNPDPTPIQNRLHRIKHPDAENSNQPSQPKKPVRKLIRETSYGNQKLGMWLEQFSWFQSLRIKIEQADIRTPSDTYLIKNIVAPFIVLCAGGALFSFFPAILIGLFTPVIGVGYVIFKRQKRYQKFIEQLPDALMLLTSALRAGHSFQSALSVTAIEMPDPIGMELSLLVRDMNLGLPVKDSLLRLVLKMDSMPDVCMFSTAVAIQREAGGNLAEVLETLGNTIRERFKLRRQIASLTGQSRITGYVMGAAPMAMLLGLSLFFYSYIAPLYETEIGHIALIVAIVMQLIGFFVMRKIIAIRL